MRPILRSLLATGLLVALAAGCSPAPDADPGTAPRQPGGIVELPDDLELLASLSAFDGCTDLLAYVKDAALELVTPYGLQGGGWWGPMPVDGEMPAEAGDDSGSGAPMPSDDGAVGSEETGTNVQEAGVDEPDRVKTDGRYLYLLTERGVRIVDLRGGDPVEVGRLDLSESWDAQLLLAGDHLLLTSSAPSVVPFPAEVGLRDPGVASDAIWPQPYRGTTTLAVIDVSDPRQPEVTQRLRVDGATLSARLIDGVARIVVRTEQGRLPWVAPQTSGLRAERAALEANRQLIRDSVLEDWLPYRIHETADGATTEGPLLDCDALARPGTFSGLGIVSILTLDLAAGELSPDTDGNVGVLAGGDTVYASHDRLTVATTRWVDWERLTSDEARVRASEDLTTELHSFDLTDRRRATYVASGSVPGTLLSQWALSEHEGVLRVASTVGDLWGSGRPSRSMVTTLTERDGDLVQLGQVDGLGVTERIYAVRFIGEVGYVVTFRQVDPLYTIDLSDPRDPRVLGELKILGYSAYLHPMGDGLLLGVGQDADDDGRTKGTQLSLFDVSDLTDPVRLDQVTLDDASSDVEHDHRAFLHHVASGLTVVPFTRWSYDERSGREDVATGAVAFTASREDGLTNRGTITHVPSWIDDARRELGSGDEPAYDDEETWARLDQLWQATWQGRIARSLVVDDGLVTVSELGVAVHDLGTIEERGWLAFDER